ELEEAKHRINELENHLGNQEQLVTKLQSEKSLLLGSCKKMRKEINDLDKKLEREKIAKEEALAKLHKLEEQMKKERSEKPNSEESTKTRADYLKELKDEIEELQKQDAKGAIPLLEYIYKTWPPKDENHKLTELTTDPKVQEKALRQALGHYHPDKQDIDHHGMKWCVIAEEITKLLARKYNNFR
ncbi:unnamed protein product, partial [Meganyctiphanes norvegica]